MAHWSIGTLRAAALTVLAAAVLSGAAFAGPSKGDAAGARNDNPRFTTAGSVDPQFLTNARTIPHFTFQYKDPQTGVTYPITMVGADPRDSNATTVVRTVIVPLKINFVAAGQDTSVLDDLYYPGFHATPLTQSFDGTTRVADVLESPIFSTFPYASDLGGGSGQYGDQFMRAQFGKIGTGYHVTLQNVQTFPTQVIDVPASKGIAYNRAAAQSAGKEATAGIVQDSIRDDEGPARAGPSCFSRDAVRSRDRLCRPTT